MMLTLDQVNVLHRSGRFEHAEAGYREVLALEPNSYDAQYGLGVLLLQVGRATEALPYLQGALALRPRDASVLNALGGAYLQTDSVDAACVAFETVVQAEPNNAKALANYGTALLRQNDATRAINALESASELAPSNGDILYNFSRALRADGRLREALQINGKAIDCLEQSDATNHLIAEANLHRAQIHLQEGRFLEGWASFDWRMKTSGFRGAEALSTLPVWDGADLSSGALLVWTEQGPGDEILYASMISDVEPRASRIIVACTNRLVPIFARSFPFAEVVSHERTASDSELRAQVSAQLAAGSLGQFVRQSEATFPERQSYLRAGAEKVSALHQRYKRLADGKPLIGLSWRSGNPHLGVSKSVALTELTRVAVATDATFVDLQYGDTQQDRKDAAEAGLDLLHDDQVDSMVDLDAFVAQVAAMDLVITVSNTTAHVAGALGIPCWTLVSKGSGQFWYWFLDRSDSPWYPSMRLFRQTEPGDWQAPLDGVKAALQRWEP